MGRSALLALVAATVMVCACGGTPTPRFTDLPSATLPPSPPPPSPTNYPTPLPPPTATGPTPVPIFTFSIRGVEYGYLELSVSSNAICNPTITYPDGAVDKLPTMTAGASEKLSWTFPQKPRPAGLAHVVVVCTLNGKSDTETADFQTVN